MQEIQSCGIKGADHLISRAGGLRYLKTIVCFPTGTNQIKCPK